MEKGPWNLIYMQKGENQIFEKWKNSKIIFFQFDDTNSTSYHTQTLCENILSQLKEAPEQHQFW